MRSLRLSFTTWSEFLLLLLIVLYRNIFLKKHSNPMAVEFLMSNIKKSSVSVFVRKGCHIHFTLWAPYSPL